MEAAVRRACSVFEEMGDLGHLSGFLALLADVLADMGRFEEAESQAARAWSMSADSDVMDQILLRRARAKILAARGDLESAVRTGREAVELTHGIQDTDLQAGVWMDLGPIFNEAGRQAEAIDLATQAVEMWERKGNLVRAARAREVLRSMSA
ncbi:MAG TPA: tetratricopeptide repeat protein [Actinomycetota bacterium]|nr:tetratricopeptide repeat protein [Actinomycetota bacterium]